MRLARGSHVSQANGASAGQYDVSVEGQIRVETCHADSFEYPRIVDCSVEYQCAKFTVDVQVDVFEFATEDETTGAKRRERAARQSKVVHTRD